jgi:N-acetylneuraminic acid mutarotase
MNEPYGWRMGPPLPVALGEVASGVIDGVLYVVGEGSPVTLGYDIATDTWSNPGDLAARPYAGHHHAAEVVNGNLFLFGGLHDGSPGKVQIYDPLTNSWSLGTDMPWAGSSSSSALINGEVYVCGGIVGSNTVTDCGKYDPVTDTWTPIASMIDGRNHAASATDGVNFYIFGGRGPGSGDGNVVANGFADVQIYDPLADIWESSNDPGSTLEPLPQARGGTGKAVFFNGEFYVLGGETLNGAGATPSNTYDRMDIYDPLSNTWRLGPPMPTARHGIFPVLHDNQVYLGGGGRSAGFGQSDVLEIYAP